MINYDSILSAFDGKPTLLQWLKLVKKALDESVLKDITASQDGASAVFTFNFEDGTSLSTPAVTLPKGDTGAKGDKGDKGDTGVSVTGVDEVSNEVVGTQTLTTLRFNFSNDTNNEVVVHAENGKSGGKLYRHDMYFYASPNEGYRITIYNSNATPYTPETFFADLDNDSLYCCGTVKINSKIYPIYMTAIGPGSKAISYINSDGSDTLVNINVSQLYGSDDVTEV